MAMPVMDFQYKNDFTSYHVELAKKVEFKVIWKVRKVNTYLTVSVENLK